MLSLNVLSSICMPFSLAKRGNDVQAMICHRLRFEILCRHPAHAVLNLEAHDVLLCSCPR